MQRQFESNSATAEGQRRSGGKVAGNNGNQSQTMRIACEWCRKGKLRCDGARPKCGACTRNSRECGYSEGRKKSGPKRGYVQLLERRIRKLAHSLSRYSRWGFHAGRTK
jgi:hypothetical protein